MDETHLPTLGVLVATYRRPEDLLRCLTGIATQHRQPDDVIVVVRPDDTATHKLLERNPIVGLPLRVVEVTAPGLIAARNAGVDACCTDILAMIDDDAVPHADWLRRIVEHFRSDPSLGGLGGRDRCYEGSGFDESQSSVVGKLQWFGRTIGNHHRGFGVAREVDFLKGANMSYRAAVFSELRFDVGLRGSGAQPNEDMRFSLQVRSAGWKLLYDPQVLVDHYAQEREEARFYVGATAISDRTGFKNFAYNEVAAIWDVLPMWRRIVFVIWSIFVGTRLSPGLLQAVRLTPRIGRLSWLQFAINMRGKLEAIDELGWRCPGRGGGPASRRLTAAR